MPQTPDDIEALEPEPSSLEKAYRSLQTAEAYDKRAQSTASADASVSAHSRARSLSELNLAAVQASIAQAEALSSIASSLSKLARKHG